MCSEELKFFKKNGPMDRYKEKLIILTNVMFWSIWYHLYDFKNVIKHPWKSVTFSKVAG